MKSHAMHSIIAIQPHESLWHFGPYTHVPSALLTGTHCVAVATARHNTPHLLSSPDQRGRSRGGRVRVVWEPSAWRPPTPPDKSALSDTVSVEAVVLRLAGENKRGVQPTSSLMRSHHPCNRRQRAKCMLPCTPTDTHTHTGTLNPLG